MSFNSGEFEECEGKMWDQFRFETNNKMQL